MNISQRPLASAFAAALTLAAGFSAMAPALAQEAVTIGAAAPLTGPRANLGRYFKQGVDLAVEEINKGGGVLGKPLKVVYEDDQADNPNVAINAVNKLVKMHKVTAFVGPHFSVAQLATQKIYCGNAVSVTGASGVPVTSNNCKTVIRNRANDNLQAKALVEYARNTLKIDKLGVLSINDDFGKAGAARVIQQIEAAGLKPVRVESHNPEDKDFSAQLGRLRDAGVGLVIMWTHDNEAALIVRQAKQLGLTMKFAGSTSLSQPVFVKLAADAGEGALSSSDFVPGNPDPAVQEFVKKYEARTKTETELYAATYYDATWLLAKAINQAGSTDPMKIREAFGKISHKGVLADYRCEANGDCNHQINIIEVQKGQPVVKTTVKF
ncbi:Leucine-, isoleucine-, valine-, threonine-, and alanine-binding protein precursor [Variovorax sp. PBS-H4]|uniref:ABC transporter substrate-binding protein n=1 Tax=Variovorax sp. PBS-H4 TaxID=434008 RepID=UPI001316E6A5|nr:ABC transporter substrate-binding protein [Variovorax sp. PBS-H4]VTU25058.1 Leucine-, isoleucine-, valine-, threonine-, and alanine-binding protein precursor [Variovorax sp. PBS-H4]